jgi:hypothetical protein
VRHVVIERAQHTLDARQTAARVHRPNDTQAGHVAGQEGEWAPRRIPLW